MSLRLQVLTLAVQVGGPAQQVLDTAEAFRHYVELGNQPLMIPYTALPEPEIVEVPVVMGVDLDAINGCDCCGDDLDDDMDDEDDLDEDMDAEDDSEDEDAEDEQDMADLAAALSFSNNDDEADGA